MQNTGAFDTFIHTNSDDGKTCLFCFFTILKDSTVLNGCILNGIFLLTCKCEISSFHPSTKDLFGKLNTKAYALKEGKRTNKV